MYEICPQKGEGPTPIPPPLSYAPDGVRGEWPFFSKTLVYEYTCMYINRVIST